MNEEGAASARVIAGRYELREHIGAGGSGAVFRAHDGVLDRDVALKVMRPGADAEARARLRIEARLSGLLAHPGIVRVHDFGEEDVEGQAAPYLVMEYVDGVSLRDLLRREAPLAPDRVMTIVAQVADALAVAHGAGVVHRDVKPSNILLRPDGTVALIDFGIARGRDVEPVTLTGTIVGTVDYISPEQAAGSGATALSDLYALGLVAYECLTGERPLRRDNQVATVLAHVNEDVPALPRSVPGPVRDLVRRLTARDPRRRPPDAVTAARLARAALGATASLPIVAPPARRRPGGMVAAAVAAVAVFGACVLVGQGEAGRPPAEARPSVTPDVTLGSPAATTRVSSVTGSDSGTGGPLAAVASTSGAARVDSGPRSTAGPTTRTRESRVRKQEKAPGQAKGHHKQKGHGKGR